jgi:hypothetical protein
MAYLPRGYVTFGMRRIRRRGDYAPAARHARFLVGCPAFLGIGTAGIQHDRYDHADGPERFQRIHDRYNIGIFDWSLRFTESIHPQSGWPATSLAFGVRVCNHWKCDSYDWRPIWLDFALNPIRMRSKSAVRTRSRLCCEHSTSGNHRSAG